MLIKAGERLSLQTIVRVVKLNEERIPGAYVETPQRIKCHWKRFNVYLVYTFQIDRGLHGTLRAYMHNFN